MIAITLISIVKLLVHWPLTEEILGSNPFDCKFFPSNLTYCGKTRLVLFLQESDTKLILIHSFPGEIETKTIQFNLEK